MRASLRALLCKRLINGATDKHTINHAPNMQALRGSVSPALPNKIGDVFLKIQLIAALNKWISGKSINKFPINNCKIPLWV